MKIELNSKTTNLVIEIPESAKKIGVTLSGGADSAILLYILCQHIKQNNLDVTVLPITSCVLAKPIMIEGTFRVSNRIRELFNYDLPFLLENFLYYKGRKIFEFDMVAQSTMLKEGVIDFLIGAGTSFASEEELKKHNMWDDRPVYRGLDYVPSNYENLLENDTRYKIYKPFLQVDKKFIAEMYDLYGVRETLLPYTRSCIASFSVSKGWSKPCKTCWWCKERYWAFGSYDAERRTYMESVERKVYSWNPPLPKDDHTEQFLKIRSKNLK